MSKKLSVILFFLIIIFSNQNTQAGKPLFVIGVMSGTSLDGIDVALLKTDGETFVERGPAYTFKYPQTFRDRLHHLITLGRKAPDKLVRQIERDLTKIHAQAINGFIHRFHIKHVDLIGFHGQTLWHQPDEGKTCQIGDGELLAQLTEINVVTDFRTADITAGGQGAPLAPLYHRLLIKGQTLPIAVLNIGGVANITYVDDTTLIAFDTGPGGALIDDWVYRHLGKPYDENGELAHQGQANTKLLESLLKNPYFQVPPPKSLDRNEFSLVNRLLEGESIENGAATLTLFTAECVRCSLQYLPKKPNKWYVCGGGRLNKTLMANLTRLLKTPVLPIDGLGVDGDFIEAELIAYLAVRSVYNLPLTLPSTTGVSTPTKGGVLYIVSRPLPSVNIARKKKGMG